MDAIPPTRRRWQTRARKPALALLLIAGLSSPWAYHAHRKGLTIREIERLNGLASSRYRLNLGLDVSFGPLDSAYFLGPKLDDEGLRVLEGLPALKTLTLTNTRVTDEGLARLGRYRNLNFLCIANIDHSKMFGTAHSTNDSPPFITGKGLAALEALSNLQSIQLMNLRTTDEDLAAIGQLKGLVQIDLVSTRVTPEGVAALKEALPNCRIVQR